MADPQMIEIASDRLFAAINPLGAELSRLRDADGRDYLTDGDPEYWTGRAPLLFPVVGRLAGDHYRLDGRDYALPQHGFARRQPFALVDRHPDRVTFRLAQNDATLAAYPFRFTLDAAYRIEGTTLAITVTATNWDDRAMPASFGFHPGFAWPLPGGGAREAHRMIFSAEEPGALKAIVPGEGLIGEAGRASPLVDGRVLPLADALFDNDALIWDPVESRGLVYQGEQGPALEIGFGDATQLGIWTKRPGAPFVCVEPWWGIADPHGFEGEIWEKPGIRRIEPGQSARFGVSVTLRD